MHPRHLISLAATLILCLGAGPGHTQASNAQTFPNKPIRLLVGYTAGGPADNAARRIAPALQKELGQPVVIENRGGAGGVLGADVVAKSDPDGYTLIFMSSPTQVMTPHMMKSLPFDPIKDFTPVSMAVGFSTALLINKDFPARTLTELVAYAKANPDKVSFGSAGIGSSNHLAGELLKKDSGTSMLHVPYKGNSLALSDVISGQLTFMFSSIGDSIPFVNSGQVRALAVSSKERSRALPNVPTMSEAGIPGFNVTAWYALEGPAKMPANVVARLNAAMRAALADPSVMKQFTDIGYDVIPSTPGELAQTIETEFVQWSSVARGVKLE